MTGETSCHLQHALACCGPLGSEIGALGDIILFKSIGCHYGIALQQLEALTGSDVAHRGEGVGSMGCCLLERMLGLHVELGSHLVAKVARHVVIKGLAVAADAAPDARGMGGEHGSHLGQMGLDIKQSHSGRPFVEVGNDTQCWIVFPLDDALDNEGCGIGKHARLVIVAIGMERIHAIAFPHLGVEGVLVGVQDIKGHQDGNGLAWHVPVS